MKSMHIRQYIVPALTISLILLSGCKDYESSIPDRDVYISRFISLSGNLADIGGYLYIDQKVNTIDRIGFGGILIYHAIDGKYYAVDLACPHEVSTDSKIGLPNSVGQCTCNTCGETYDMLSGQGTPTKGISKESLKQYSVSFKGSDEIVVTP
jgi:nitrite reductase/ring-hydroxylating ferredoxin subunit